MRTIDLNCDVGESFGVYRLGEDALLVPHVSSVNIACGFHAGDPATMRASIELAVRSGAAPGAHPGLRDREGFGRRAIDVAPEEVYDMVVYQVGALAAFARAAGTRLQHVKPHGALYNMSAARDDLADAIARAVRDVDRGLVLFALAGSRLVTAGREHGMAVAREAFADRNYLPDGSLVPRGRPDALVRDPEELAARAARMVVERHVHSSGGGDLDLEADTLCIHGDTPGAATLARRLRSALADSGIAVRPVGRADGLPLAGREVGA
jgi:5-oxoprolinase (ATP-hydrolysing) subunit A